MALGSLAFWRSGVLAFWRSDVLAFGVRSSKVLAFGFWVWLLGFWV
jgi:uncharacterized membrane protein YccC